MKNKKLLQITTETDRRKEEENKEKFHTDEKIKLMQHKNLLHELYMMTLLGSKELTPYENDLISDMILERR